jgi:hypothetical protein
MTETYTAPVKEPKLFGVWLPGEGWLKGKDIFADVDIEKAKQVARLIGRGAVVYFIDKSIIDFEQRYLDNERKSIWMKIKNTLSNSLGKIIRN